MGMLRFVLVEMKQNQQTKTSLVNCLLKLTIFATLFIITLCFWGQWWIVTSELYKVSALNTVLPCHVKWLNPQPSRAVSSALHKECSPCMTKGYHFRYLGCAFSSLLQNRQNSDSGDTKNKQMKNDSHLPYSSSFSEADSTELGSVVLSLLFWIKSMISSFVRSPSYCNMLPPAVLKYKVGNPLTSKVSFGKSFAVAS